MWTARCAIYWKRNTCGALGRYHRANSLCGPRKYGMSFEEFAAQRVVETARIYPGSREGCDGLGGGDLGGVEDARASGSIGTEGTCEREPACMRRPISGLEAHRGLGQGRGSVQSDGRISSPNRLITVVMRLQHCSLGTVRSRLLWAKRVWFAVLRFDQETSSVSSALIAKTMNGTCIRMASQGSMSHCPKGWSRNPCGQDFWPRLNS